MPEFRESYLVFLKEAQRRAKNLCDAKLMRYAAIDVEERKMIASAVAKLLVHAYDRGYADRVNAGQGKLWGGDHVCECLVCGKGMGTKAKV